MTGSPTSSASISLTSASSASTSSVRGSSVPLIEFRDVSKSFGSFAVLNDLSLSIFEGEFFALLGPSGCGKTTLMRLLAGFEHVDSGDIFLAGESVKDVPPHRRPVNMMFQSYALFPHMSVWNNVAFGLRREGMPKNRISERVDEMLSLVKMEKFSDRKPEQLSGGQRQRVALARSLAKQPKVLLLDEPLAAVDRKLREETQFELVDLQERVGITFVIVTHDQEEAMTVADRIAVMDRGAFVQIAPPVEMYERPNSVYVADFLGDINLLNCQTKSVSDDIATLTTNFGVDLFVKSESSVRVGSDVHFGIRPQKMFIDRTKPSQPNNVLEGEVIDIAYLGDMTIYKVSLPHDNFVKVFVLNREVSDNPITWNEKVFVWFDSSSALVLER